MLIYKVINDILTGIDNETFDNGRVLCLLSYVMYFGLAVASFYMLHPWGAMDFAGGIGAMGVGFGVNLKLKEGSEPKCSQT
jgi:hypothetical protein